MNIKLATERLQHAQDILIAIEENRPIKNCIFGIFEAESEYLTMRQTTEAYRVALEDAGKFIS
jgi:hypothetical protein